MLEFLEKIRLAGEADPEFWGFQSCITEDQLLIYEKKLGISIPEEYREFLLRIANGSQQPYLGMYPLEETLGYIKEKDLHFLSQSFPFQEKYMIRDFKEYYNFTFDELHLPGCLPICNYGCGIEFLLILSGESRGEIWFSDPGNDEQLLALYSREGVKYNFLTWLEAYYTYGDIFEEN